MSAWIVILTIGAACRSGRPLDVQDLRGRRVVEVDRPVVATEFYSSKRVLWVKKEPERNGPAGFTFAIEFNNDLLAPSDASRELQLDLPRDGVRAVLLVSGDRGRPYYSQKSRGYVRIRQFADATVVVADVEFESAAEADLQLNTPEYIFREDKNHLRVTGTFTADH